jgi:glycerol-3-phosphate dehydrogenase
VTRDYVLQLDGGHGIAPVLSVFGGKITTFRKLADQALSSLAGAGIAGKSGWASTAPLPGGDLPKLGFEQFVGDCRRRWPWFPPEGTRRLARAYGTRIEAVLGKATATAALGEHYGGDLFEEEVRYLTEREYARSADDILWRRSKLGLHLPAAAKEALARRFAA